MITVKCSDNKYFVKLEAPNGSEDIEAPELEVNLGGRGKIEF